jgi:hypothetical protein
VPPSVSKDEKAKARAEVTRIQNLSPTDLAVEIMPAFGPDGAKPTREPPPYAGVIGKMSLGAGEIESVRVCYWLMRDYRRGGRYWRSLHKPVVRSLHVLTDAGLIENVGPRRFFGFRVRIGGRAAQLRPTQRGETALAEKSVRQYLSSTPEA